MFMAITGIDLFDQNAGMACTEVRHRCSWLSLVLCSREFDLTAIFEFSVGIGGRFFYSGGQSF